MASYLPQLGSSVRQLIHETTPTEDRAVNITKSIHLYFAVLLLLAGQTVLGAQQRIQARSINQCVEYTTALEYIKGKNSHHANEFEFNSAVAFCNGGR